MPSVGVPAASSVQLLGGHGLEPHERCLLGRNRGGQDRPARVRGRDVPELLRQVEAAPAEPAFALMRRLYPGWEITEGQGSTLGDGVYPPEGTVYAARWSGVEIVCDQGVIIDVPSQLREPLVAASRGRRLVLHAMHSVVDWLAFAVWEDGRLIRSLSLSPDSGIMENIGDPLPFELPYWAGDRPADVVPVAGRGGRRALSAGLPPPRPRGRGTARALRIRTGGLSRTWRHRRGEHPASWLHRAGPERSDSGRERSGAAKAHGSHGTTALLLDGARRDAHRAQSPLARTAGPGSGGRSPSREPLPWTAPHTHAPSPRKNPQVGGMVGLKGYFLPWFLTASIDAAAASGSR
ncbi:hypothetical protein SAMN05216223_11987 [Actinacidiphila yanglinensis]|uniref:Uncharacterized protein n=1 Tax=Actinacidiphila yanglinensis TaxID=310779 RepID=A0A1H6DTD5_9ACTN|nr:hypothetical protein SAMN05216223_11987 [Actinacidiphila yanglinensis]